MTQRDPNSGDAKLDRRALFTSAAAATLLAASGVSAAGLPKQGGRLRMALSGASRGDSWTAGNGLFMQVARLGLVFDTLTEVAADGSLRGELATHWRASEDALNWEFTLRTDAVFHDGAPFTATDAAFSIAQKLGQDVQVLAVNATTLHIALDQPDAGLPLRLSEPQFVIRAAHAPDAAIGTGLYQVKHFSPGQQLVTQRVKAHFKDGHSGWFDEVELVSIPSQNVRAEALGEYLVDAIDLNEGWLVAGLEDVMTLPNARQVTLAANRELIQPRQIGGRHPMDDLRAAERWWFI